MRVEGPTWSPHMETMKITNVETVTFAPIASSVIITEGNHILPERFTSVSTPTGGAVVAPELSSVSAARVASQKSAESR
jgi:hypothetical protein